MMIEPITQNDVAKTIWAASRRRNRLNRFHRQPWVQWLLASEMAMEFRVFSGDLRRRLEERPSRWPLPDWWFKE